MWDSVVKNIGVLTAAATLVGSAIAFFIQRADDIEQKALQAEAVQRESKRVFLEKQAEIYFEMVPLVSRLANVNSASLIDEQDEKRFWELFWGELGMVEDVDVARAMDIFGQSLKDFQSRNPNSLCAEKRKSISLTLSHCVRKSLGENWGVDFRAEDLDWCTKKRFEDLNAWCPPPSNPKETTEATRPARSN
jgi:hypothetical protein